MKTLRKRWAITLVLFVLTIVATGGAYVALPTTYQAKANVILLPSTTLAKTAGGNPYLAFDSTLNQAADVIRYEVTDARTALALQNAGYTQNYAIADAIDTSAPVLLITVTGKNAGAVENTLTGVTNEISTKLAAEQTDITSQNKIRSEVITFSPQPTKLASKKLRSVLVVFAAALLLTFAIPLSVDATAARRRRRASDRSGQDTGWQPANEDGDRVGAYQAQEPHYAPAPRVQDYPRQAPEYPVRGQDYDLPGRQYGNGPMPQPKNTRPAGEVPASATRRPRG
jgi:hypothetical protein